MSLIGSFGKRTTNLFNYAGSHKFYVAGAATALPVFFIAAGSQISGHSGNNNLNDSQSGFTSDKSAPSSDNITPGQSIPDSSGQPTSDTGTTADTDNTNHTEATATIDGQSISASTDGNDQSVHKTLNTDNGTASISIEQHSDSSGGGQSHSSSNVSVHSQANGSGSSSDDNSQDSTGGISR
jgi:hypothetical protein